MRWVGIAALVLVVAGCAARRVAPPAAAAPAGPPAADVTPLIERGCYACLQQAFAAARDTNVPQAFEAAALLALRSLELGLPHEPWLQEARTLAAGDAAWSAYLDIIAAVPRDPLAGDRDVLLSTGGPRNRNRLLLPLWREILASGPASGTFRRYVDWTLACAVDPARTREDEIARELDGVRVPLLRYRAGICGSRFWKVLADLRYADDEFVDADYALGKYALENRENPDHDEAMSRFRAAAAAFPESAAIAVSMGNLYQAWEEWPQALEAYDAVLAQAPTHPDALLGRTIALSNLNEHHPAIEAATRLIDGGRWFLGQASYWRAWNQYHLDNFTAARADADRTRTLMVNAAVFVLSGMIEWRLRRLDTAEKELEEALAMDFGQCEAALFLGVVRSERRKVPDAVAAFTQARQCFDLSIAVRRQAIANIEAGPGSDAAKARNVAREQRVIDDAETRKAEAERALAVLQRPPTTAAAPPPARSR